MKSRDEVLEFIRQMIDEVSLGEIPAAKVRPDQRLINDLGLDSLDYATVLLSTEAWLGIRVSEKDVDWTEIATVESLTDFLCRHLGS